MTTITLPPLPFDPVAVRDRIYTQRSLVGRKSDLGRHYSKLGEQTENLLKAKSQHQVDRLAVQMIETHKDIKALTRVRIAAPTLMLPAPSLPKGEA